MDFTTLDDNNKTEFLEFLLKNNISFEKGSNPKTDGFVAKVAIDNKGILKLNSSITPKKGTQTTPKNNNNKKPYQRSSKA